MFMFLLIMYVLYRMMFRYPYGRYMYRPMPRPLFLFGPFYRRPRPMFFGPMRRPMCCYGPHHGQRF